jgi:hypothetical protein
MKNLLILPKIQIQIVGIQIMKRETKAVKLMIYLS